MALSREGGLSVPYEGTWLHLSPGFCDAACASLENRDREDKNAVCVAANSVGSPQLALSPGAVSSIELVAQSSENTKSWRIYLGQPVLESSACCCSLS